MLAQCGPDSEARGTSELEVVTFEQLQALRRRACANVRRSRAGAML